MVEQNVVGRIACLSSKLPEWKTSMKDVLGWAVLYKPDCTLQARVSTPA